MRTTTTKRSAAASSSSSAAVAAAASAAAAAAAARNEELMEDRTAFDNVFPVNAILAKQSCRATFRYPEPFRALVEANPLLYHIHLRELTLRVPMGVSFLKERYAATDLTEESFWGPPPPRRPPKHPKKRVYFEASDDDEWDSKWDDDDRGANDDEGEGGEDEGEGDDNYAISTPSSAFLGSRFRHLQLGEERELHLQDRPFLNNEEERRFEYRQSASERQYSITVCCLQHSGNTVGELKSVVQGPNVTLAAFLTDVNGALLSKHSPFRGAYFAPPFYIDYTTVTKTEEEEEQLRASGGRDVTMANESLYYTYEPSLRNLIAMCPGDLELKPFPLLGSAAERARLRLRLWVAPYTRLRFSEAAYLKLMGFDLDDPNIFQQRGVASDARILINDGAQYRAYVTANPPRLDFTFPFDEALARPLITAVSYVEGRPSDYVVNFTIPDPSTLDSKALLAEYLDNRLSEAQAFFNVPVSAHYNLGTDEIEFLFESGSEKEDGDDPLRYPTAYVLSNNLQHLLGFESDLIGNYVGRPSMMLDWESQYIEQPQQTSSTAADFSQIVSEARTSGLVPNLAQLLFQQHSAAPSPPPAVVPPVIQVIPPAAASSDTVLDDSEFHSIVDVTAATGPGGIESPSTNAAAAPTTATTKEESTAVRDAFLRQGGQTLLGEQQQSPSPPPPRVQVQPETLIGTGRGEQQQQQQRPPLPPSPASMMITSTPIVPSQHSGGAAAKKRPRTSEYPKLKSALLKLRDSFFKGFISEMNFRPKPIQANDAKLEYTKAMAHFDALFQASLGPAFEHQLLTYEQEIAEAQRGTFDRHISAYKRDWSVAPSNKVAKRLTPQPAPGAEHVPPVRAILDHQQQLLLQEARKQQKQVGEEGEEKKEKELVEGVDFIVATAAETKIDDTYQRRKREALVKLKNKRELLFTLGMKRFTEFSYNPDAEKTLRKEMRDYDFQEAASLIGKFPEIGDYNAIESITAMRALHATMWDTQVREELENHLTYMHLDQYAQLMTKYPKEVEFKAKLDEFDAKQNQETLEYYPEFDYNGWLEGLQMRRNEFRVSVQNILSEAPPLSSKRVTTVTKRAFRGGLDSQQQQPGGLFGRRGHGGGRFKRSPPEEGTNEETLQNSRNLQRMTELLAREVMGSLMHGVERITRVITTAHRLQNRALQVNADLLRLGPIYVVSPLQPSAYIESGQLLAKLTYSPSEGVFRQTTEEDLAFPFGIRFLQRAMLPRLYDGEQNCFPLVFVVSDYYRKELVPLKLDAEAFLDGMLYLQYA